MQRPDGAASTAATSRGSVGFRLQAGLIVLSMALVLAPPADGAMLIAPLVPGGTAATVNWALAAGATLVAPGPYPGSVIVAGSSATLLPGAIAHGALLLTARLTSCGDSERPQT